MSKLKRRRFLQAGSAAAASTALSGTVLARTAAARQGRRLIPDPEGILDLPEGFSYRVLQRSGALMSDGYKVPGRPDGMGCFPGPDGTLVLLRNHEIVAGDVRQSPYVPGRGPPPEAFDPLGTGGVTRCVVHPDTHDLTSSNLVLAGTLWNCAGGPSPWGWMSCEETVEQGHGYVFLCRPESATVAPAEAIKAYGRFRHEAATVDPKSHIAYLTEDRPDAAFYRFVPESAEEPFGAGKLQALAIDGQDTFLTASMRMGLKLPVRWVDIDDPDPAEDTVRMQAQEKGAAVFVRGEGIWLTEDEVYICATAGGPLGLGQVFRLGLAEDGPLEVAVQPDDPDILDMPDNLTVSPSGHLYMAEDGFGDKYLRRLTLDGRVVDFARNALSTAEFAGPCFSPDGSALFVNLQDDGLTLCITGPFDRELAHDRELVQAHRLDDGDVGCRRGGRGLGTGLAVLALAALARRRRKARGG